MRVHHKFPWSPLVHFTTKRSFEEGKELSFVKTSREIRHEPRL